MMSRRAGSALPSGSRAELAPPPRAEGMPAAESHRLVLFDIDGTLVSAGRAARESILAALAGVFEWTGSGHGHDFSGKTDPQIVRELVAEAVGPERFEEGLPRALEMYLAELSRRMVPELVV